MLGNWRIAPAAIAAGIAGAVALAAPAAADVTVTPAVAPQGGPAALVFTVPEERAGAYTTKIELLPPAETPIAEVYPMSVTGWAPVITARKLDKPIELIHGTTTKEIVAKVTWKQVGKVKPKDGQPALLKLSMGPMPQTEQVAFTIVQTYSDGTVVKWADAGGAHPAPVVKLLDIAAASGEHGKTRPAAAVQAAPAEEPSENTSLWIVGAALVAVLGIAVEGWILFAARRRRLAAG